MLTITFQISPGFTCPEQKYKQKYKKLVKSICKRFCVNSAIINIVITDNRQIRSLNKKFHHRDTVTDCLSFDLSQPADKHKLFDIIVNAQKAKSEANKRGHSPHAELALYIAHGLLHNIGFDDLTPNKSKIMHQMEDKILQQQGFGIAFENHIKKQSRAKC
jgi:probable rRNA maturation factor